MILEKLQKMAKALDEITEQKYYATNRQTTRSNVDASELGKRLTMLEREIKELPKRLLRRQ